MAKKQAKYTERLIWRKSRKGGEYASYSVGLITRKNGVLTVSYPEKFRFLKIKNVRHAKDIIDGHREQLIKDTLDRLGRKY